MASAVEVVLPAAQLVAAQVAVACCASRVATAPDTLGDLEACRVPMGAEMDALARRLRGVRRGDPSARARPWAPLRLAARDGIVQPQAATAAESGAVVALSGRESALLTVAVQRLRGVLLHPPAGIDPEFAEQVDGAARALLDAVAGAGAT